MASNFRLHALLPPGGGVQLWLERVSGHAVVRDVAEVPEGELPDRVRGVFARRALRTRGDVFLATPTGRLKKVAVPTVAFTPAESLQRLRALAAELAEAEAETGADAEAETGAEAETETSAEAMGPPAPELFSPELVFVLDLFRFVTDVVRAGRVMLRLDRMDEQWFPRWVISSAGDHQQVLQRFREQVPGVLVRNGGKDVVVRIADDWAQAVAGEALHRAEGWESPGYAAEGQATVPVDVSDDAEPQLSGASAAVDAAAGARAERRGVAGGFERQRVKFETRFMRAVVDYEPLPQATARTVEALNQWRMSAVRDTRRLALILSAPQEVSFQRKGDAEEPHWCLKVGISVNSGPVEEVADMWESTSVRDFVRRQLPKVTRLWPEIQDQIGSFTFDPPQLQLGIADVEALLEHKARKLQEKGIVLLIPREWAAAPSTARTTLRPAAQGRGSGKLGMEQLVDFDWELGVGGHTLDQGQRAELLSHARRVVQINGEFVYLGDGPLQQARRWWREIQSKSAEVSVKDVLEANLDSARYLAALPGEEDAAHSFRCTTEGWFSRILAPSLPQTAQGEGMGASGSAVPVEPMTQAEIPATIATPLREHQQRGVNWLAWMQQHQLGAILADDMGLGKTLQILSLIAWDKAQTAGAATTAEAVEPAGDVAAAPTPDPAGDPGAAATSEVPATLVIAPTSVLDAWRKEVSQHAPSLSLLLDHGTKKLGEDEFGAVASGKDIVLTTYGTIARNPQRYRHLHWRRIVADEAQNIKNPGTKQSRAVRSIPATHHIALTGTPVENRLSDLYAIMDFANPGILGSAAAFNKRIAIPIEKYDDAERVDMLRRITEPFVLRRLKNDPEVGEKLPEKTDLIESVPLTPEQAALYQAYTQKLQEDLQEEGNKRRGIILGAMVKFKQLCDHPALFSGDNSGLLKNGEHRSGKIRRTCELVADAHSEGRKVLIFTQFPSLGAILAPHLATLTGRDVPLLHGGSSRSARARMVNEFQNQPGPGTIIVSTRAGGTGITLTAASVVIHIDRWWNPAVEDQATDRAYRIGQDKNVIVHKLVSAGTIDEKIHEIISGKRELAASIIGSGEGWITELSDAELNELWQLREVSTNDT